MEEKTFLVIAMGAVSILGITVRVDAAGIISVYGKDTLAVEVKSYKKVVVLIYFTVCCNSVSD